MTVAAATAFLARRDERKLSGFNNSMMVSPGVFQLVSQEFDSRGLSTSKDQKSSGSSTESTDHPESALHRISPLFYSDSNFRESDSDLGLGCGEKLGRCSLGASLL